MASISGSSSSSSSTTTSSMMVSYPRPTENIFAELNSSETPTYTKQSSMQDLVQLMQTSGKPLVALARLASSYLEEPKPCAIFNKQTAYGWKPGVKRDESAQVSYSLILGAKQQSGKGNFVFFVECQFIRVHESTTLTVELAVKRPSEGYYIVSHRLFNKYLKRILVSIAKFSPSLEDKLSPLAAPLSLTMPLLSKSQQAYVDMLRIFGPAKPPSKDPGCYKCQEKTKAVIYCNLSQHGRTPKRHSLN